MECARLINWCIDRKDGQLIQKWLVRAEINGRYKEILSEVNRPLLDKCHSVSEGTNAVLSSHNRPIPYHPIHVVRSQEDGRILSYLPKCNDWEDLTDIPILASIADEIRLVTVIVQEQERPSSAVLNNARSSVVGDKRFFLNGTSKNNNHLSERLTFLTKVRPTRILVKEQHRGKETTKCLSAKQTLDFLQAHALDANRTKETLTIYRLHMNRTFARAALHVICKNVLTEKQYKPELAETDYVFLPNPFFRFVFFVDRAQADSCPIERLFLEQYFIVPCETGTYNASCADNVAYVFSRMVPFEGDRQMAMDVQMDCKSACTAVLMVTHPVNTCEEIQEESKIAVFDYKMFYPFSMCAVVNSPSYQCRVLHMATVRSRVPSLKKVYVKELGMLRLVRQSLYQKMRAFCLTILDTLIQACRQTGIQVLLTQTDSVTVRVPVSVLQAHGGSLEQLALVLQKMVRKQHPNFLSELKLERQGTSMIIFSPNKHILYQEDQLVHRTGFEVKTHCPAMSRTIQEATYNRHQALQLLFPSQSQSTAGVTGYSAVLHSFVSRTLTGHTINRSDLACESYGLPLPMLTRVLYVKPGDDAMYVTMPPLYKVLSKYRKDYSVTIPSVESFFFYLTRVGIENKAHLPQEQIKRVLESVFSGEMMNVRWHIVLEELTEHFVQKTIEFLSGGFMV